MHDDIKDLVIGLGADVCGIANVDRFLQAPEGFRPTDIWVECKSVVVFGIALPKGILDVRSRVIYSHFNTSSCAMVDAISFQAAKKIERQFSTHALPLPCDGPYEYWDAELMEGRGILSMKHAAVAAGLGSFGKSSLLLNAEYGTMLTIGAILTKLDLRSDELHEDLCLPGCDLCIGNCPSRAIGSPSVLQKNCRLRAYGKTDRGFDTVDCNRCRSECPMRFGSTAR